MNMWGDDGQGSHISYTDTAVHELNRRLQEIDKRLRFIEKEIQSLKEKYQVK
jgi:tetrahydromethanopterin S-methyltransferase subunit G